MEIIRNEQGLETVQWLGMSATVLTLIMMIWLSAYGAGGSAVRSAIQSQISVYAKGFEGGLGTSGPKARMPGAPDTRPWIITASNPGSYQTDRYNPQVYQRTVFAPVTWQSDATVSNGYNPEQTTNTSAVSTINQASTNQPATFRPDASVATNTNPGHTLPTNSIQSWFQARQQIDAHALPVVTIANPFLPVLYRPATQLPESWNALSTYQQNYVEAILHADPALEASYNAHENTLTLYDAEQQRTVIVELSTGLATLYDPVNTTSVPIDMAVLQQSKWITIEYRVSVATTSWFIALPTIAIPMMLD